MYLHPKVLRMEEKSFRIIKYLFEMYYKRFDILPKEIQKRVDKNNSKERVICDYIAGMTDSSALEEYQKFTEPFSRV
jgi:dGTPase